jgi:hypothetical protein
MPNALPNSLLELCASLEERGIPTWSHGEGLLEDLRPGDAKVPTGVESLPTRSLLCAAEPGMLLAALPRAVVTASRARRVTLATASGPVDLLPVGQGALEERLLEFGLSPLAFAFRPADGRWCDPIGARTAFENGVLDITTARPNPFRVAPRRYWIAARLLSQYALEPATALLEAARSTLPETLERLPQGASARREISRILASPSPERGLAFLRESGVSSALFPGLNPAGESSIARLRPLPALRWAAWLHGSAIQHAMVRLRMPIALARRIECVHRSHPIDRSIETLREIGIRKILARLDEEEVDGLFAWRRLELAARPQNEETRTRSMRLDEVEARLTEALAHRDRSGRVLELALDGKEIMGALGTGPGPHIGRALAHLATFVEAHPQSNEREALERELRDWAERNPDAIR